MSDILEQARNHFANMGRRPVEVPEWGAPGSPTTFYAPSLTLADRQVIERRAKGNAVARLILTVILHLQNEDGTRAFTDDAETRKAFEREIDPEIVSRLALAILNVSEADDLGN